MRVRESLRARRVSGLPCLILEGLLVRRGPLDLWALADRRRLLRPEFLECLEVQSRPLLRLFLQGLLVRWHPPALPHLAGRALPEHLRDQSGLLLLQFLEAPEVRRNLEVQWHLLDLQRPRVPANLADLWFLVFLEIPSILEALAHRQDLADLLALAHRWHPR